jgi:CheY-like chemotaxis protein
MRGLSMQEPNGRLAPLTAPLRILVAEDEFLIRFGIAEELRELGVTVVEAVTADEAWEHLKAGDKVDVVFTDDLMPGSMKGSELARRIAEELPAILVILTSAVGDGCERKLPFVAKPYPIFGTAAQLVRLALENRNKQKQP